MYPSTHRIKNLSLVLFFSILSIHGSYSQASQQWLTTYNGIGDFTDRYTCIASDQSGDFIVAGSTVNTGKGRDLLIRKFNQNGGVIWSAVYNAPGDGSDEASAIVLDASGNAYVTGLGKSDSTSSDFLTVKVDASGNIVWARLFDSPFNQYDQANGICVDPSGHVIVTGQCDRDAGPNTNDDIYTVKYDPNGNLVWSVGYNGIGNTTDRGARCISDATGAIYVTGRSDNGNDNDIITIKYDAGGNVVWTKFGDRGGDDRGVDIALDPTGFIYVCGRSDNGSNDDYYLIKYSLSGQLTWTRIYDFVDDDRPVAMQLDGSGNIYLTGQSDQNPLALRNWDIRTVKFSPTGTLLWAVAYDGTASGEDLPLGLDVSATGDVYVSGTTDADPLVNENLDVITLHYTNSGNPVFTQVYAGAGGLGDGGNDVCVNAAGTCMVAGYVQDANRQFDALLLKVSTTGMQDYLFSGQGDNSDNVRFAIVNPQGETYLAGYTNGRLSDRNFLTVKLNSNGDTAWTRIVNGSAPDSEDEANDIIFDSQGNVIVCGWLVNSGVSSDIYVVKYTPIGDTVWTYRYNGFANESDKAYDIDLDPTGNILITGRSDSDPGNLSNDECVTIKLSPNGVQQWISVYAGPAGGNERGTFVETDNAGNSYVVGRVSNGVDNDILVIKYDNAGNLVWQGSYSSNLGDDLPVQVCLDGSGNLYVAGRQPGVTDTLSDIVVLKYTNTPTPAWSYIYNGSADEEDRVEGMILDINGDIVLAGSSDTDPGINSNSDFLVIKLNASGQSIWTRLFDGGNSLNDRSDNIACDASGQYYVLGHTDQGSLADPNDDVVIYALDPNGNSNWNLQIQGSADTIDAGRCIIVNGNDLYATGSIWNLTGGRDIFVAKFAGISSLNDEQSAHSVSLYPNPARDHFRMNAEPGTVIGYRICSVLGATVQPYREWYGEPISVSHLPAGMYQVKLKTRNGDEINQRIIID